MNAINAAALCGSIAAMLMYPALSSPDTAQCGWIGVQVRPMGIISEWQCLTGRYLSSPYKAVQRLMLESENGMWSRPSMVCRLGVPSISQGEFPRWLRGLQ